MPASSPFDHVHELGRKTLAVDPAQVHAQQHFGPVLGFGAAGPGVNVDDGVVTVVRAGKHALDLELIQPPPQLFQPVGRFEPGFLVLLLLGQVDEDLDLLQILFQRPPGVQAFFQNIAFPVDFPGLLGVVPEPGLGHDLVELGQFGRHAFQVKDNLEACPGVR